MAFRESERRQIGMEETAFGMFSWPVYEYRCAECGKWTTDVCDITRVHDDGTQSHICQTCFDEVAVEFDKIINL